MKLDRVVETWHKNDFERVGLNRFAVIERALEDQMYYPDKNASDDNTFMNSYVRLKG